VIGSAGSSYDPELGLPCSSYLLDGSRASLLLDCGIGAFEWLATLRPVVQLDAIIVSHAHADHVADLKTFLTASSWWKTAPRLIASRATIDALAFDPVSLGVTLIDYVDDGIRVAGNGFVAEFSSTHHQIPTLGVQVTMDGSRLVYSADTGPGWAYPATFRTPDVAIVECTFEVRDDSSPPFHLDACEVAALVNELRPLATLITHVPPNENGERRRELVQRFASEAQILLAHPGLTLEIGRGRPL
jgi:ribonuclease BN (tRNA processing enzyme)